MSTHPKQQPTGLFVIQGQGYRNLRDICRAFVEAYPAAHLLLRGVIKVAKDTTVFRTLYAEHRMYFFASKVMLKAMQESSALFTEEDYRHLTMPNMSIDELYLFPEASVDALMLELKHHYKIVTEQPSLLEDQGQESTLDCSVTLENRIAFLEQKVAKLEHDLLKQSQNLREVYEWQKLALLPDPSPR